MDEAITEDDLIAAVLAAYEPVDDVRAMTTVELVDATGRSDKWVLKRLRELKRAGRLVVTKKLVETLDDRVVPVRAYLLKE